MAWIKMRASLLEHTDVVAMSRYLMTNAEFRAWLAPNGDHPDRASERLISPSALQCVTVSLLLRYWSVARERGQFVGDDLILPRNTVADIDVTAGAPGLGAAMQEVGWVVDLGHGKGITLPRFKAYNVSPTGAERQRQYRLRQKSEQDVALQRVTKTLRNVTRSESESESAALTLKKNPLPPTTTEPVTGQPSIPVKPKAGISFVEPAADSGAEAGNGVSGAPGSTPEGLGRSRIDATPRSGTLIPPSQGRAGDGPSRESDAAMSLGLSAVGLSATEWVAMPAAWRAGVIAKHVGCDKSFTEALRRAAGKDQRIAATMLSLVPAFESSRKKVKKPGAWFRRALESKGVKL